MIGKREVSKERDAPRAAVLNVGTAGPQATFNEKCAALEAAFNRLREPPATHEDKIPYKMVIPGIARELMLMTPVQKPKSAAAEKGLQKVAAHAGHTVEALDSLSEDALQALNLGPAAIRRLRTTLRILKIAAKSAEIRPSPRVATKVQPRKIARRVGEHYCALTGKLRPTVPDRNGVPYGPFLELLIEVFRILGVNASAASQGRAVSKSWARSK